MDRSSFMQDGKQMTGHAVTTQDKKLQRFIVLSRPIGLDTPAHPFQPGDRVNVKCWDSDPLQAEWRGSVQVLLTTLTTVRVAGKGPWTTPELRGPLLLEHLEKQRRIQMKMMWFKLFFLCLLSAQSVTMIQLWNQNLHAALVQNVSNALHKNSCWICTQMPRINEDNNWPLIGVLMNETNLNNSWEQVTKDYLPVTLSSLIPDQENYKVPCVVVNVTGKVTLPPYCHKTESKIRLVPKAIVGLAQTPWRMVPPQGSGWYWICKNEAWKVLPLDKDRACALGAIIPDITVFGHLKEQSGWRWTNVRRIKTPNNPLVEHPMIFHSAVMAPIPSLEVNELEKAIVNISAIIEHTENQISDAIMASREEVWGLARVILQNRLVLDFLLVSQGGMCRVINTSCCSYIDETGRIKKDLAEIWKQTQILDQVTLEDDSLGFENNNHTLTSQFPKLIWIIQLFILVVFVVSVCIMTWCMFRCCSFWSSLLINVKYKW
ncbi:PREDICTED: syncytin-1-like [Corvus brachyrhynchos]|uniref:syncytin-1-like n=1 Tax=Corvus brachyrhynchos TaxID=85066 RepID=UPI000816594E|nr:PREDICTED: syncytin-1-like [Corvus brachyrhynchos]